MTNKYIFTYKDCNQTIQKAEPVSNEDFTTIVLGVAIFFLLGLIIKQLTYLF